MGAYTIIHGDSIASFAEIQSVLLFLPFLLPSPRHPCSSSSRHSPRTPYHRKQSWGWFASVMGVDVAISTAMLYFLYIKPQKMHGQATTSSPLRKIIIKAIQSNVLSAVCQICIGSSFLSIFCLCSFAHASPYLVALYASFPTSLHYTYFGLIEVRCPLPSSLERC